MYKFIYNIPTKIYFGSEQLLNLGNEIKKFGSRVLLCYGGGSIKKTGIYQEIMIELKKEQLEIFEFNGIGSNPEIELVKKGSDICKNKKIDVLLAIGGGSVIDCTKMIGAATFYSGDPWDLVIKKEKIEKVLPILTIVTVAATGSEMNSGSVISNVNSNDKIGVSSPFFQPKVSFLDPKNTFTVSRFQTACGSVDIFSHVMEAYFNSKGNMYMLDCFMEGIMKTIIKYGPIALNEPTNEEARANLMWASSWAINGFISSNQSCAWTCHLLEHQLSAYYNITHGLGLAIVIPRWMRYILDKNNIKRFKRFAKEVFNIEDKFTDKEIAIKGIEELEHFFFKKLGLIDNLTELKIDSKNFNEMAKKCLRNDFLNGYKKLSEKDIVEIYKMCL